MVNLAQKKECFCSYTAYHIYLASVVVTHGPYTQPQSFYSFLVFKTITKIKPMNFTISLRKGTSIFRPICSIGLIAYYHKIKILSLFDVSLYFLHEFVASNLSLSLVRCFVCHLYHMRDKNNHRMNKEKLLPQNLNPKNQKIHIYCEGGYEKRTSILL